MSAVATKFERAPAADYAGWAKDETRSVLRALLGALDRLVPPRGATRDAELPQEWFRYPPI